MATFFGEILPVISRAVEDDDDEDVALDPCFTWQSLSNIETTVDYLVISAGCTATGFLKSYCIENDDTVEFGQIIETLDAGDTTTETKIASFHVKTAADCSTVYCLSNAYLAPDKLWSFSEEVLSRPEFVKLKEVIILDSSSFHQYFYNKPQYDVTVPFVRSIATSAYEKQNIQFPFLNQPNMVKGLSAVLLSHCEMKKLPAVLYIVYTETISLDVASISAFLPLLKHPGFKHIQDDVKAMDHVKALVSLQGSEHSLYI